MGVIVLARNTAKDHSPGEIIQIQHTSCGVGYDRLGWQTQQQRWSQSSKLLPISLMRPSRIWMGALTKLDISNNNIEQGKALQGITDSCNTKGIVMSRSQISSPSTETRGTHKAGHGVRAHMVATESDTKTQRGIHQARYQQQPHRG
jgi:hypothetical protein